MKFKLNQSKSLLLSSIFLLMSPLLTPQPASAAIARFFGWRYSDNETYQQVEEWVDDITGIVCGYGSPISGFPGCHVARLVPIVAKIVDPPSLAIVSGRVTVDFDPSNQLIATGWYGEFGADPLLPAPPVDSSSFDSSLLQSNANPALQSASITPLDQANADGKVVFNFDWGSDGFIPTKNLNNAGHFNILGLYFIPASTPPLSAIGTSPNPYIGTIVGSLADIQANGTNASTYLTCKIPGQNSSSTCGEPVPEPTSTLSLLALGTLGAASTLKRKLKPSKTTTKELEKVG